MADPTTFRGADPDPKKVLRNRDIITQAKARQTADRPKDLQGVHRFDEHPQGWNPDDAQGSTGPRPPAPKTLSKDTVAALKGVAAAQPPQKKESEAAPEDVVTAATEVKATKTDDQLMRDAVEARLGEFDIGQYLISGGELTQRVPIIPGKLEVIFRLVSDAEEVYVDRKLREENDLVKGGLADREMFRRLSEWSLASHIVSVNDQTWGPTLKQNGDIDEEAMKIRFAKVRRLPSQVLMMISQNLAWFVERATKSLTFEALKNG